MPESRASSRPVRVLLVDDDAENRRLLRRLLEAWDLDVVGEAADGMAGVELAGKLLPDVVLMDVRMPIMDGIEATKIITGALPRTRVVLLTDLHDRCLRRRAEEHGASAYLSKEGSAVLIRDAILRARRSEAK
ncbi:MAG: response regulator transcription factor [Actinomycetota bacterium]